MLQIEKKLEGEPVMSRKTDAAGKLVFSGIDRGVYLIRAEDSLEDGTITSSLVHLPYYETVDDEEKGPLFSVKVNPKASLPGKPHGSAGNANSRINGNNNAKSGLTGEAQEEILREIIQIRERLTERKQAMNHMLQDMGFFLEFQQHRLVL